MALDKAHLQYPERSYGMDHERYDWSQLSERKPVSWPGGAKLALWINISLQYFPLDQKGVPFKVPGGMTMPYPDLRHYSLRDYGNRVGVYRCFKALDQLGLKASVAMNTRLAERYPYLLQAVAQRGDEILCHGYHMDALHYGGQDSAEEAALVSKALGGLRELSGQPVAGWLSPARNESEITPELLAENGVSYFCDWVNDDMPYYFKTKAQAPKAGAELVAMPLSNELEDRFVVVNNQHSEASWCEQVVDACDFLLTEAEQQGGRILALNIHPWLMGQPHRIGYLEKALAAISSREGVWSAQPGEILAAWQAQ